jgi:flavin reductase (DIM6/NTAB) family NADH-FMN oxidoreductase RutF
MQTTSLEPDAAVLPEWPPRTVAILSTVDHQPHAIPISAPVRAGERRILFSLRRDRDSVARIRAHESVALTILAEGDVAFTARGRARLVDGLLPPAQDDYVAIELEVDAVDDHRQRAFVVSGGVDRTWHDDHEREALGARVASLREA